MEHKEKGRPAGADLIPIDVRQDNGIYPTAPRMTTAAVPLPIRPGSTVVHLDPINFQRLTPGMSLAFGKPDAQVEVSPCAGSGHPIATEAYVSTELTSD